jgi:hypothetical protein
MTDWTWEIVEDPQPDQVEPLCDDCGLIVCICTASRPNRSKEGV